MLSLMIHVGDEGSACDRKKYNPLNPVMYSFAILLPSNIYSACITKESILLLKSDLILPLH